MARSGADDGDRAGCVGPRERLQRDGRKVGLLPLEPVDEEDEGDDEGEGWPVGVPMGSYRGSSHPGPGPGVLNGAPWLHPDAPAPVADRILLGSQARDCELFLRERELGAA